MLVYENNPSNFCKANNMALSFRDHFQMINYKHENSVNIKKHELCLLLSWDWKRDSIRT